MRERKRSFF